MIAEVTGAYAQVERVLASETFRNSQVLKRLLEFLAKKSLAGEADQLKEYTIGIDALGKPDTYDPREDSVVRIQVGRLRQKLTEYYRSEGRNDELIIELPKGHFGLLFNPNPHFAEVFVPGETVLPQPAPVISWKMFAVGGLVLLMALWSVYATVQLSRERSANATLKTPWTPELEQLWRPVLTNGRPLIISTAAPLFVGFQGEGFYRDLTLNTWDDVQTSPKVRAIRKALGDPPIVPRYYYSGMGQINAAFLLGRLLSSSTLNVSIARSNQLSWQQFTDNNILIIGPPRLYQEQLKGLTVPLEIVLEEGGIRILHPRPGEAAIISDEYASIDKSDPVTVPDNGELIALITRTPGPLGSGDIQSFSSNHSPGTLAAVQWFTSPILARTLVGKLKLPSGEIPRYYQVVVRVKYKDSVPTETSYVMHRELHVDRRAGSPPPPKH